MVIEKTKEQLEQERRKKLFEDYRNSDEIKERFINRLKINQACMEDEKSRQIAWNMCARPDNPVEGCKFFINNFGWTFDPRPQAFPHHLPFFTYPYQDESIAWLIDHIDGGRDGLLEKSRDMGVSWIVFILVPIWYWLFRDGINILMGSYKEALVDNRTKDSLFGMIDYAVDSLPEWLLPRGFSSKKHRNQMKLINPVNNNLLSGDTMNPDFGRGSRKTAVLFDELGSWDYAKDAWETCGDTTSCRIANSTPKGYNYYARLRDSGIDVLTLHWSKHPLKDQTWYEYEKTRRTPEEVAQELDISYNKSQEGRVYSDWDDNNVRMGKFPYNPEYPLYVAWDFGREDPTSIIWAQIIDDRLRIVDTYEKNGKLIDFFIPFIHGIMPSETYEYTPEELEIIKVHANFQPATHFGDPAGRFRNQVSNQTVESVLKDNGINVNYQKTWNVFETRKTAAKGLILKGIDINQNKRTEYLNLCMQSAAFPKVKNDGIEEVRSQKPKHDWTSHNRSAFEYLALGLGKLTMKRTAPVDKFPPRKKDKNFNSKRRRSVGY